MNSLIVFALFVATVCANPGFAQLLETDVLLKGPSARSALIGSDGSGISTHFEGGVVATTHDVALPVPEIVVARAEPIISYAEPIIARAEPLYTHVEPVIARHEPLIAPVWEQGRSDIIAGPSGTIITNKEHLAPIFPVQREIFLEPAVRTVLPTHGLTYGRSLFEHGFVGLPRSSHLFNPYLL